MFDHCHRRAFLRHGAALAASATLGTLLPRSRVNAAALRRLPPPAPSAPVAIQRCDSYDPTQLMTRLNEALDLIGGIRQLVANKTVTVKLNLTGGPRWKLGGLPAYQTYHVHPQFVAATCAALHHAGATKIVLVESGYSRDPLDTVMAAGGWDIEQINRAGGGVVSWEDTRHMGSWKGYSRLAVPWGGFIYPAFDLNTRYEKTDVFVSLAKLKDHANAGVTMAVKNLFGIAPTSLYGDVRDGAGNAAIDEQTTSARGDTFHKGIRMPPAGAPQEIDPNSPREWSYRVPRVTADLYGARLPDLCLVDGIETNRGGEGPWIQGVEPITPHLLLAGTNGVCTDAVCTAAMGYDPMAHHGQFPFMGDNHLMLLAEKGIGAIDPAEIEVRGLALKDAVHPFNPKRLKVGDPIFR
ncbi:MAG: DUF362 domain-containing protein [Planctomycetes bacterium]|nr:DUF362 domain-containing protein [Planctomycetota bacterium]